MENEKHLIIKAHSDPDTNESGFTMKELATVKGFASLMALAVTLRDEQKGVRDAAARSLEDGERHQLPARHTKKHSNHASEPVEDNFITQIL